MKFSDDAAQSLPDTAYPDFAQYWAGTRENRVLVPVCGDCGRVHWPPRPACKHCGALVDQWRELSRLGHLYSWTVVGRAMAAGFEDAVPYTVVAVSSLDDESVRFIGNLVNADDVSLAIGMQMEAVFREVTDEVTLVDWRPSTY